MSGVLYQTIVEPELLDQYLHEISRHAPIEHAQEVELARRIRIGEQSALDTLVASNLRMVVSVARRYQSEGVPLAELIHAGNEGLMRAAQHFDDTEGVRFVSYAVGWIRQAILEVLPKPVGTTLRGPARGHKLHHRCGESAARQGSTGSPASELVAGDDVEPASGASDLVLMEGIREGSHASLGVLLRRYWGPLVSYASRITERGDEADDVVQETFVRVWRQRTSWTASGAVGAYLYRITRNLALNARRDRKAQHSREERGGEDLLSAACWSDPAEDLDSEALRDEVRNAIAALPERRREVLVLCRFQGLSHQEIAEALGLSRQTVANHMRAALIDLRSALAHRLREG